MTPEQWRQVKELFRATLECPPNDRPEFIDRACEGDAVLRHELESLLSSFENVDGFMETPVTRAAANLFAGKDAESLVGQRIGHYEILALLGQGGMDAVYLARDGKLGRKAALKLLPGDFTVDADRLDRFQQEACAASSLNHPNILTIYEIGESSGTHFIATEFIDGETLRQRIGRSVEQNAGTKTPFEIDELLRVGEQIASALAAAHEAGIVHRDIKPENVMIRRDSLVKVVDFGIAKLMRPESRNTPSVQTGSGMVMGTIPYMSPEQALARKVDERSDIFSFGVLLYEMATGQSPFAGANPGETLDRILHAQPRAMVEFNSDVPPELERLVESCLQKDREQRTQTARSVFADLASLRRTRELSEHASIPEAQTKRFDSTQKRRVFASPWIIGFTVIMMLALVVPVYRLLRRGATAGARPEIKSLAVLPLENLSGDPAQDYFADGMTESLINDLAQIRALKVISRTSVMRYKGTNKSVPEIAKELNVDALIEGSVQRSGDRVRVTAQLIHAGTDNHLWSSVYERNLTDVLRLESEVARTVADEIRIQLTAEERARLSSAGPVDPQAHEAYLLGRYHLNKANEDDLKQAVDYFSRAIQITPGYAAAYAGLSDAWVRRGIFGAIGFSVAESPARDAALKAVQLDEQSAEGHIALANVKYTFDWDWTGAEQESKRALELDPGTIAVHVNYGHLLMALGRHDEAIAEGQRALQLDPMSSGSHSALGRFLYRARRYEEALPHLERAVQLEPRDIAANARLGEIYAALGRYDEAIGTYRKIRELGQDNGAIDILIARVYALMGRRREALQMIRGVTIQPILVAGVYAALGDKDEAFKVLERGVQERSSFIVYIKADPPFENLHSDPRWSALLRRMNFPTS